jgi:hypothetical protein
MERKGAAWGRGKEREEEVTMTIARHKKGVVSLSISGGSW